MLRMMHRARLVATFTLVGLGLAACDGGSVGAYYRYDDSLYWNDYYYVYGRPGWHTRPDKPAKPVPPIGTAPRPVPPIATLPRPRPPIGTVARPRPPIGTVPRPMPRIATPPRISAPLGRPARAK